MQGGCGHQDCRSHVTQSGCGHVSCGRRLDTAHNYALALCRTGSIFIPSSNNLSQGDMYMAGHVTLQHTQYMDHMITYLFFFVHTTILLKSA